MTPEPGHDTDPQALRAALRRDLASAIKARELDAARRLREQARLLTAYLQ